MSHMQSESEAGSKARALSDLNLGPIVVIGLDMGDGGLIRHWSRTGHLPHLAAMIEGGHWIDLESSAEILHTSAWPTFATGTFPGRHGVYYPYQPLPGHQQAQLIRAEQYGAPTFWNLADQAGRRCLVFDVPETFPEAGFSGTAIFEWGTWAWYGEPASQPAGLLRELGSRLGPYPLGMEAKRLGMRRPDIPALEERLLRSVEHKGRAMQWLMGREPWDLIIASFCETHPAGHYLWPFDVSEATSADEDHLAGLRHVYSAVDEAVGALVADLPPDATMILSSGDGVRPNRCGWHLLPAVLERLGYVNSGSTHGDGDDPVSPRSMASAVKSLFPPRARRRIADSLPWWLRDRLGMYIQASRIDWTRTRAFTLPTDLEGCIRINVKGREPEGIVEPGAEYDALIQEMGARLLELVNPATGDPAVRKIWLRNEVLPGERREQLPDLVVSWNDRAPIQALEGPGMERIAEPSPDPRTGTHSTSGFLLARAPGIPKGRSRGNLVQVAPTILRLLGVDHSSMDGEPLDLLAVEPSGGNRPAPLGT